MKILILGVNGFIGSALTARIMNTTDWQVYGLDINEDKIENFIDNKRFRFLEGDISINREWIQYHIKKSDVVLPLVAIATPKAYVEMPLTVFELDFESNLQIIKDCVKYNKRIIFPSTSEVYGMCIDEKFNEESSNLILGPIHKQRWIYSCSKQLLDRVIYAFGAADKLNYTLFRPFNWVGPNLDSIDSPKEGSSRVLTQFLGHIKRYENITLVNGGKQKRCFTYIEDGINCLMKIIINKNYCADKRIFNIGNPDNELSVKELAEKLIASIKKINPTHFKNKRIKLILENEDKYYGKGYQDVTKRKPDISNAKKYLNWRPIYNLDSTIDKTVEFYFGEKSSVDRDAKMSGF